MPYRDGRDTFSQRYYLRVFYVHAIIDYKVAKAPKHEAVTSPRLQAREAA